MSRLSVITVAAALLISGDAPAYVGPGPGLSMLGSLLALLGGVALALAMVLVYPIRLLLKRRRQKNISETPDPKG